MAGKIEVYETPDGRTRARHRDVAGRIVSWHGPYENRQAARRALVTERAPKPTNLIRGDTVTTSERRPTPRASPAPVTPSRGAIEAAVRAALTSPQVASVIDAHNHREQVKRAIGPQLGEGHPVRQLLEQGQAEIGARLTGQLREEDGSLAPRADPGLFSDDRPVPEGVHALMAAAGRAREEQQATAPMVDAARRDIAAYRLPWRPAT